MAFPDASLIRAIINDCLSDSRFSSFIENGRNVQHLQQVLESLACEIGDGYGLTSLNDILEDSNLVAAINSVLTRLASNSDGYGASLIGVEDAYGNFVGNTVEEILNELYDITTGGGTIDGGVW